MKVNVPNSVITLATTVINTRMPALIVATSVTPSWDPTLSPSDQVLFFRELGVGLDEIRRMMDEPDHQRRDVLGKQRELLLAKSERLLAMVEVIDRTIAADREGINMTTEEILGVFGDFDPADHQAEVEDRWGDTDVFKESSGRVSGYSKQDWIQVKAEASAIDQGLLNLMANGVGADSVEAMDMAEQHSAHITKWFYQCTPEIHAGLGQMYVSDLRFKENIDEAGSGLAQYLSEAIAANHERQ